MLKNPLVQLAIGLLVSGWLSLTGLHSDFWGGICLAVLAVLVIVAFVRWWQLPDRARFSLKNLRYLRWGGRIPLREAAQIIYTEARAQDSVWAHAAERMSLDKSPDGILSYIAEVIKQDTVLYGKRPPSTNVERLDPTQAKYGTIADGARELHMRDNTKAVFTDLAIDTRDLRRALQEVRENLKTTTLI